VKESDIKAEYIKPNQAGDKLKDGALDAFFFTGGAPAGAIAELASAGSGVELLNLTGASADGLRMANPYFSVDVIPAGTYKDVPAITTLAVGAQWVTSSKVDAETVYQITKAMFSEAAQKSFQAGHAKGKLVTAKNAVLGVAIPFHAGAERYYKEVGLMK
jgi:TRAP transporter TAXI family solute receptor